MTDTLLKVSKLNKAFGGIQATKNLSFDIQKGNIHALIGPNGAGKTTVVNQLCGDIPSDSGDIFFNDQKITSLKAYQRAKLGIARSFQITHVFENLSVAENMAIAICAARGHNFKFLQNGLSCNAVLEDLPKAMDQVDLSSRAEIRAGKLSHGEKRQLEVGMALAGNPKLLILDEPMAGMGPGGTVELTKLIKKLSSTCTILLVEHDMDVVFSLADRITVLVYGENIATGSPEQIKNNDQVKTAYLGDE